MTKVFLCHDCVVSHDIWTTVAVGQAEAFLQ